MTNEQITFNSRSLSGIDSLELQTEFQKFREGQDILNDEVSQKQIETELLRVEQQHFLVNFSTYKYN